MVNHQEKVIKEQILANMQLLSTVEWSSIHKPINFIKNDSNTFKIDFPGLVTFLLEFDNKNLCKCNVYKSTPKINQNEVDFLFNTRVRSVILHFNGVLHFHGAAVCDKYLNQTTLLMGKAFSGKSSCLLKLFNNNRYKILADDLVIVINGMVIPTFKGLAIRVMHEDAVPMELLGMYFLPSKREQSQREYKVDRILALDEKNEKTRNPSRYIYKKIYNKKMLENTTTKTIFDYYQHDIEILTAVYEPLFD